MKWQLPQLRALYLVSCHRETALAAPCTQGLLSGHQPSYGAVLLCKAWTSKARNSIVCGSHVIAKKDSSSVSQTLHDWLSVSVLRLANWNTTSMHHCQDNVDHGSRYVVVVQYIIAGVFISFLV